MKAIEYDKTIELPVYMQGMYKKYAIKVIGLKKFRDFLFLESIIFMFELFYFSMKTTIKFCFAAY